MAKDNKEDSETEAADPSATDVSHVKGLGVGSQCVGSPVQKEVMFDGQFLPPNLWGHWSSRRGPIIAEERGCEALAGGATASLPLKDLAFSQGGR